jgi:capsular exopolysaccharide synthesis family protein
MAAPKKISNINDEFDPTLLLVIARRNQLWVALVLIVCASAAVIYNRYTHPVFQSNAVLQLNTGSTTAELMQYDPKIFDNNLASEIELMRSSVFLGRVVNKLDLKVSYFKQGNILSFEQYKTCPYRVEVKGISSAIYDIPCYVNFTSANQVKLTYENSQQRYTKVVPVDTWVKVPLIDSLKITVLNPKDLKSDNDILKSNNQYFLINNPEGLISFVSRNLTVSILNEAAKTIKIVFNDRNANKAADVVNTIANEFLTFDVEKKSESASKTLAFLDTTINRLYDNLSTSEDELNKFKLENSIVEDNTEEVKTNPNAGLVNKIDELENDKLEIDFELKTLEVIEKEIDKKINDVYGLISLSSTTSNSSITKLLNDLQTLLLGRQNLLYDVTLNSSEIKAKDYQIEIQKKLIVASIASLKASLIMKSKEYGDKIVESNTQLLNKSLGYDIIEFSRLKRQNQINEKYYNQLVIQKAELTVLRAGFVPQNMVLDFGTVSKAPVYPDKKVIVLSAILTWLIISFGLIIFRYLMHSQISNIGDIIKLTQVPILGFVPKFSEEIPVSQLIVDKKPKSLISEAFRSIRANLDFISNTPGAKLIAVTSTISGEGKTFVSINLGGIIAFSEKKVILIDLDMRKPKIHQGFDAPNDRGMSTLLIGKDTIEDCVQHRHLPNLDFITAGPIPPNPSELIISKKMEEVIDELKSKYDVVVVDNPPVGLVTDGIRLISMADYPIYILKANYSKKNFILNIEKLVNENNVTKLGIILNNVENNRNNYGYGYSYGYNYGYGYGYGYGYLYGFGYYDEEKGEGKEKEPLYKRILKKIIPS